MDVRTIMTADPVTASADASLDELMRAMDEHDVRHLPIVDGGSVIGVLSDRDLYGATGWIPQGESQDGAPGSARDLVGRKPVHCSPDDSVVMVAVDLTSRLIGCLPVLEDGALAGIVTEMDLLGAYVDVSQLENSSAQLHDPVSQHMSPNVTTLPPTATMEEALELSTKQHIRHLPIVLDDKMVGIVSDRDLRKALGRGHGTAIQLSEIMSPEPLTLAPDETLSQAAARLLQHKISALPVVDGDRLVGILTLIDLLEHCIVNLRNPDR